MTNKDALILLAKVLKNKSPYDFAKWAKCDIDVAIEIFASVVGCLVVDELFSHRRKKPPKE